MRGRKIIKGILLIAGFLVSLEPTLLKFMDTFFPEEEKKPEINEQGNTITPEQSEILNSANKP